MIKYKKIKIKLKQVDKKQCIWNCDYRPHYKVRIKYKDNIAKFDFWNNIANNKLQKKEVLDCILSDGLCALESYLDFCDDFGYEYNDKQSKILYHLCKKTLKKLIGVFDNEDNIKKIYENLWE